MSLPLFDVKAHREKLVQSPHYLARPAFTSSVAWREERGAHVLYTYDGEPNDPDGPAPPYGYMTTLGRVLNAKFFTGAVGSWTPKYNQPISAAKYSIVLGRPEDPVLGPDWDASYFTVTEGGQRCLRYTMKVFEKKGGECPSGVDIAKWPVQPEYKDHLMAIVPTHDVCLLPVYDIDETLVPHGLVENKLRGALVEMTAKLVHHGFEKNGNPVDSFTAEIQQIVILRYGQAPPANAFRRAARPFRFGAVADLAAAAQPATGPTPIAAATAGIVVPRSNVVHAVGPAALNTTVAGWKPADTLDKAPLAFRGDDINHDTLEDKAKDVGNGRRRERETGAEGNSPTKKVKLGEKEGEAVTA
ncbi:hypothetical protein C8R43DRAFT_1193507 [Mycena crocata]|nr:hypothetical protein C8R43DRAFT_1177177 [Mycena crocata]KAJ7177553.1 hypothetical protein C8R43DRAFT_1193507 [Mycena crocata]